MFVCDFWLSCFNLEFVVELGENSSKIFKFCRFSILFNVNDLILSKKLNFLKGK
jgi:hypothetical protein